MAFLSAFLAPLSLCPVPRGHRGPRLSMFPRVCVYIHLPAGEEGGRTIWISLLKTYVESLLSRGRPSPCFYIIVCFFFFFRLSSVRIVLDVRESCHDDAEFLCLHSVPLLTFSAAGVDLPQRRNQHHDISVN